VGGENARFRGIDESKTRWFIDDAQSSWREARRGNLYLGI
jgi:hypothetical protein